MSVAYPEPRPAPPPRSTSPGPVSLLLRLALGLFALAIPICAVWLVTVLFLGTGSPLALALTLGVLVPLGLPFAWDFWAEAQFRKKQNPAPRILSRADRIRLRILAVCLLALAVPVLALGRPTATAIARHGAWFMGSSQTPFATDLRHGMRGLAVSLGSITGTSPDLSTVAGELPMPVPANPATDPSPPASPATPSAGDPSAGAPTDPTATRPPPHTPSEVPRWPLPEEPHPVVRAMTDAQATDLDAVARLIGAREADPFQRVKAIHDFVVRWVQYDTSVLDIETKSPPQDAETVFARKTATCDGYAKLMVDLGQRLGITMTRIVGRSRVLGSELDGFYHAWVGVEIDGKPYLVDPTWDAGSVFGRQFNARYSTAYLFVPPEIFAYDHLPKDPDWSLTEPPLDMETFLSRPALSAGFFARGLTLEGITKATTEVEGKVTFTIKNPKKQWVLVLARPLGDGQSFNCIVPSQVDPIEASCPLTPGAWELGIYANDSDRGSFPSMGFLRVVSK